MQKRKVTKRERKMKKGMNEATRFAASRHDVQQLVNPMNFYKHETGER